MRDARATRKEENEDAPQIIVGTHALLYENVNFNKLGLAVIDEQHKFGVAQRAKLTSREPAPDVLVMTATPIPRTLTMTIYGDLEISTIEEMPRGRGKIVKTLITGDKLGEAIAFLREQLSDGRQAYIVYPLIDESEKLEFFFSSRRRHTRLVSDWSSDVCSSDLVGDSQPIKVDVRIIAAT